MFKVKQCGIWLIYSLTFLLNCHVFFTWLCVLLFAMNQPCSTILIKGSMKKLVSPLKWHYESWQKRYIFVPSLVSATCEAPSLLKYTFWSIHVSRLVSLVLILCHQPWICWASMNVLLTVTIIGRNNLERWGSTSLSPCFLIYFFPFTYFRKLKRLNNCNRLFEIFFMPF